MSNSYRVCSRLDRTFGLSEQLFATGKSVHRRPKMTYELHDGVSLLQRVNLPGHLIPSCGNFRFTAPPTTKQVVLQKVRDCQFDTAIIKRFKNGIRTDLVRDDQS